MTRPLRRTFLVVLAACTLLATACGDADPADGDLDGSATDTSGSDGADSAPDATDDADAAPDATDDADSASDAVDAADSASDSDVAPAECDVEPICSAFHNDGSQGGTVRVTISDDGLYAIVETNNLASHPMGPFPGNPNTATAQDHTYRIPLEPQPGPSATPLGPVAVAWNGVTVFNPSDARDFSGCTGNAGFIEVGGLDAYGGHPNQGGTYHYHAGTFLEFASDLGLNHDPATHASLLGYAPDGYPIYGPYGYADPEDPNSAIALLRSCYTLKAARDCCTDDFVCGTSASFGPLQLSMGAFLEDYTLDETALANGECELDAFNMRFQVTPEYPEGVRAYIATLQSDGSIAYPYILGLQYYGAVAGDALPPMGPPGPMP